MSFHLLLWHLHAFGSNSYALSNVKEIIQTIPPIHEKMFSNRKYEQLKMIYKQLYQGKSITHFLQFYHQCRRIKYTSEIIGSANSRGSDHGLLARKW